MKNLTAFEKIILLLFLIATLIFLYVQFFKKPKTAESSKQEPGTPSPGSEHKSSGNSQQSSVASMEKEWTTLMPSLIEQARFKDNRIVNILSQFEDPAVKKVVISKAIEENKTLEQEILECAMHILRNTMPKNTNSGGGQQSKIKNGTSIEWAENPGDTPK